MSDKEKKYLSDILSSIRYIDLHLDGKRDFSVLENDFTVKRAIERELEIIGEATNQLLKLNPEIEISSGRKIVDTRNRIIHSYDAVDENIIWRIIIRDIPVLEKEVKELLNT
ncbi:HepT-like ribonuclease domain-containing protein [Jiulongibacter sediminis]|uniref:Antitoxin n=1 Tax=Jiulongibacter sediminis TaxID=1605367 RepID=A0A0P7C2H9_9BACT|nr:HepT-like ribonuclease domain-containing protein [Jiulongibacter sediminis]KPM48863.1 hypothetical protein AFM12_09875 [Jiulongibacter sediminis]TBX25393.1 hypothetical protein TK44_09880 [Jiulongibacter sediminis]